MSTLCRRNLFLSFRLSSIPLLVLGFALLTLEVTPSKSASIKQSIWSSFVLKNLRGNIECGSAHHSLLQIIIPPQPKFFFIAFIRKLIVVA